MNKNIIYEIIKTDNTNYTIEPTTHMMGDPQYRNIVPNTQTYHNAQIYHNVDTSTFGTNPYFRPINYSKQEIIKLIKTLVIVQIPSQTKQGQVILRCICPISKTYLRFESISKLIHWIQNPYFNSSTISSTSFKIGSEYISTTNTNFIKY